MTFKKHGNNVAVLEVYVASLDADDETKKATSPSVLGTAIPVFIPVGTGSKPVVCINPFGRLYPRGFCTIDRDNDRTTATRRLISKWIQLIQTFLQETHVRTQHGETPSFVCATTTPVEAALASRNWFKVNWPANHRGPDNKGQRGNRDT